MFHLQGRSDSRTCKTRSSKTELDHRNPQSNRSNKSGTQSPLHSDVHASKLCFSAAELQLSVTLNLK